MIVDKAQLGRRIRAIRQENGWSQDILGKRLTPPRSHVAVGDIERGKTGLDGEGVVMVARALGVPVGRLVGEGGAREMRITQVDYRRLVTTTEDSNTTVGATVTVDEGQTPEGALREVREWVNAQLAAEVGQSERVERLRQREYDGEARIRDVRSRLDGLRRRWEQAAPILEAHGIVVGEAPRFEIEGDTVNATDDGIPF